MQFKKRGTWRIARPPAKNSGGAAPYLHNAQAVGTAARTNLSNQTKPHKKT
tara:strand:- start:240 stop:392 length:153 start_codon:yes stop_codon:yes gene_type:complete